MRLILTVILFFALPKLWADVDRGEAVMREEYVQSHGYGSYKADVAMQIISKKGRVTDRALRISRFEAADGVVKSLLVFDQPRNIEGTGLLTFSNFERDDDNWLFLPALKRVKKIASRDRDGKFVGSHFTYEDLADIRVEEYQQRWLREESCGELSCDIIERIPSDPYSGYSKVEVWVDRTYAKLRRSEFFDESGRLEKVLEIDGYQAAQIGEREMWFPTQLVMRSARDESLTSLVWRNYDFDAPLEEKRHFSLNALRRVR